VRAEGDNVTQPKLGSQVDDVVAALTLILASGLPISADYDDERLLGLSCVLERCFDPTDRLNRVKAADELLREVIAEYPSDEMGSSVSQLFGVAPGSRGRTLTDRRKRALRACHLNDEKHFRESIEPKIVRTLAWQIVQRTRETMAPLPPARVLPLEISEPAQQLYRHAQRALVFLDAFDLCDNFAARLQVLFTVIRLAQDNPDDLPREWISIYGNGEKAVQLVPASRSEESDHGLWSLAYCLRYLRSLLRDRSGRGYVRERLPADCWENMQQHPTFDSSEIDKMVSVLDEGPVDTPKAFVDSLCNDSTGQAIHDHWMRLLTAQSVESGDLISAETRRQAADYLLMLSCALQNDFPEETLWEPGEEFEAAVASIVSKGAEELRADLYEEGDDIAVIIKLTDAVLDYSPPRYVAAEDERNREYVWNDEPAVPDLWSDLYVSRVWVMLPESEDPERKSREIRAVVLPGSPAMFGADYGHLDGHGRLER
jgi:hypothetical protein